MKKFVLTAALVVVLAATAANAATEFYPSYSSGRDRHRNYDWNYWHSDANRWHSDAVNNQTRIQEERAHYNEQPVVRHAKHHR